MIYSDYYIEKVLKLQHVRWALETINFFLQLINIKTCEWKTMQNTNTQLKVKEKDQLTLQSKLHQAILSKILAYTLAHISVFDFRVLLRKARAYFYQPLGFLKETYSSLLNEICQERGRCLPTKLATRCRMYLCYEAAEVLLL